MSPPQVHSLRFIFLTSLVIIATALTTKISSTVADDTEDYKIDNVPVINWSEWNLTKLEDEERYRAIYNGREYLFISSRKSWIQAYRYCKALNTYLLSMDSLAKHKEIQQVFGHFGYYKDVWVSSTDMYDEGKWISLPSGQMVLKYLWKDGDIPNGDEEKNCAIITLFNDWKLADEYCGSTFFSFVCEKNLDGQAC